MAHRTIPFSRKEYGRRLAQTGATCFKRWDGIMVSLLWSVVLVRTGTWQIILSVQQILVCLDMLEGSEESLCGCR